MPIAKINQTHYLDYFNNLLNIFKKVIPIVTRNNGKSQEISLSFQGKCYMMLIITRCVK